MDATDIGDWCTSPVENSSWHGTHVAGIIAAQKDNGIGVAGVAPNVTIMPIRVLGACGSGSFADITDGIRWAAGLSTDAYGNPWSYWGISENLHPADVLNLSLGGAGVCQTASFVNLSASIQAARAAGSVVVVSAGNDGGFASSVVPASCNSAFTVASVGFYGQRAYYSNYGVAVDIAAPGGDVLDPNTIPSTVDLGTTTASGSGYAYMQGTSQAAPFVSGIAALMFSVNAAYTPTEIETRIKSKSRPFTDFSSISVYTCISSGSTSTYKQLCGSGIAQAEGAVKLDQSSISIATNPSTITFQASPAPTIALSVSGGSGTGVVTYSSNTPSVCTVDVATATVISAGSCGIKAVKSGDSHYNSTTMNTTITVAKAAQSTLVMVPSSTTATYAASPLGTLSLSTTGGTGTGTVSFSSATTSICTVSGSTLTVVGAGTCLVSATKASDTNYLSATSTWVSITIAKATQTITFPQPDATTYGTGPVTLSATSSAGLTVSFTSGTPSVCTVSGSSVTIVTAGTCTITASQAGTSNYSAATSVPRSITINKASQAALTAVPSTTSTTYRATPAATLTLSSSGGSGGGAVTYTSDTLSVCTVSGSTVTILSAGTCTVSAAKASDTNYLSSTSDPVSITVAKAAQTITFTAPTTKTYGAAPFTISATSSAGLTVAFTSDTTEICTVSGGTVTILAAGTCTITASQAGTSNYDAATDLTRSFTISKASQATLTVLPEATSSTYDPTTPVTIALSASGGSGDGALTYASSTPTICTVTESTVTILAAGTCTVSVSKASDTNYLGATSAGVAILVTTPNFPSLTTNPTLAGTPAVGSRLTATAGEWASATSSTLQWVRCSTSSAEYAVHSSNQPLTSGCSAIGTPNATTYTLVDADLNKFIQVKVLASNASGASSVFTPTTLAVGRSPAVSGTKYPVVTGTPKLGSALTGTLGTWLGTPTPTLQRGWVRCTSASALASSTLPSGCTVIPEALGGTFTLTTEDVGKYLRSFVTASSYAGTKTWYSATTAQIDRMPTALLAPSISGTAKVGLILTAARGTWTGLPSVTYKYQWYRCTSSSIAAGPYSSSTQKPASCRLISGATSSTYRAGTSDRGGYLSVRITATNRAGTIYLFSNPTAKVQ